MLNGDVGVELVEVRNSRIEDLLKSGTHLVIEGDSYGLCCVEALFGNDNVVVYVYITVYVAIYVNVYVVEVAARHSANAEGQHDNESDGGRNDSFHDRL
jgi:hypothetical protein